MTSERCIRQLRVIKKRSAQRVGIELDDGEAFDIDPEIAVRCGLKTGAAISGETVERLRREDESLRACRRLTRYLALRVKSVAEAQLYLEKAGFSDPAIAGAIEDAIERDLLDDRRFAERYVRTRLKTSAVGPLRLLADLISHGIEASLAEQVLRPQFDRDWQRQAAETLLRRKMAGRGRGNDKTETRRLCDWLRQRGFEDDVAREVVRTILREPVNSPRGDAANKTGQGNHEETRKP